MISIVGGLGDGRERLDIQAPLSPGHRGRSQTAPAGGVRAGRILQALEGHLAHFDSLLAKPLDQLDDHERQIRRYHEALLGKPPDRLEDHERQYIEGLRSFLPDRDFVPASIEELLRTNAESGTHSILDIDGIADNPTFGVATPVPDEELVRALGTTQPTAEDVESVVSDFCENLERWQAVYFIVYKDGQPHEVRFVGRSGD